MISLYIIPFVISFILVLIASIYGGLRQTKTDLVERQALQNKTQHCIGGAIASFALFVLIVV